MLISNKQHEANRKNAQHSTGPVTPEARAKVRFNALTYGLRARSTILPDENAFAYDRLWDEFEAEWQPQTCTERCYVDAMVTAQWLLARIANSERNICQRVPFGEVQLRMLAYVAKQRVQLERSFRTAVADMQQAHKQRQSRQAQPEPATVAVPPPLPMPADPPVPPPAYLMSDGAETHPLFCAPLSPDSR